MRFFAANLNFMQFCSSDIRLRISDTDKLRTLDFSLRTLDLGQTSDARLRILDSGQTSDFGLQTSDRLWTDFGFCTLDFGHWILYFKLLDFGLRFCTSAFRFWTSDRIRTSYFVFWSSDFSHTSDLKTLDSGHQTLDRLCTLDFRLRTSDLRHWASDFVLQSWTSDPDFGLQNFGLWTSNFVLDFDFGHQISNRLRILDFGQTDFKLYSDWLRTDFVFTSKIDTRAVRVTSTLPSKHTLYCYII